MNAGLATVERKPEAKSGKDKANCRSKEPTQSAAGMPRFLGGLVQTKLTVGAPDDGFEREADAVADSVQRGEPVAVAEDPSTPLAQRTRTDRLEEHLEAQEDAPESAQSNIVQRLAGDPGSALSGGADTGAELNGGVRGRLEGSMGVDLGQVRVHRGPTANLMTRSLEAKAFTHGSHIWLGAREQPDDIGLMAHEVTHVLQQTGGATGPGRIQRQLRTGGVEVDSESSDASVVPFPIDPDAGRREEEETPEATLETERESSELSEMDAQSEADEQQRQMDEAAADAGSHAENEREGEEESEGEGAEAEQEGDADGEGGQTAGGGASGDEAQDGDGGTSALIDEELAEHERWAGAFGAMGTASSDQRARFLLDQAGQGAASGASGAVVMGVAMSGIGAAVGQIAGRRLATLAVSRGFSATPVPGLGAAIGGVMAVAGLVMRDWGATADTIDKFGEGQGYEGLANDLEAIAEVLDVACSVMDVLAGVLGGIALGMWIGAVLSAGALSPLAASLSAIALGINVATTAIGLIISIVVRPVVVALRALHTFQSQGDPSQIEAEGQVLQGAAGQIAGAVVGAAAGRAGGAAGGRGGRGIDSGITRVQSTRTGGGPRMSATAGPGPRLHVEMPEAPAHAAASGGATPVTTGSAAGRPSTTARPAATDGPVASSPGRRRPEESFADLDDVVAELNASPEMAVALTDTRTPLQPRATPWGPGEARAYGNVQAARHRAATGMSGGDVQAGHTAAARHARESDIAEADWDRQQWMDLHSRRGGGLNVSVTDVDSSGRTRTRTRTRHTAQELLINDAVERSREATGGRLTPQGQLDAADLVAWQTENLPWRQQDIDAVRAGGRAPPERGAPVDPATGRVIEQGPAASSPARSSGAAAPTSAYASNTETVRTTDRSAAMAQYHAQVRADTGRESGVWRDSAGNYYVMQGASGSVAPPAVSGRLELVYHSHPTESATSMQGLVSQPSQAAGDLGVLQYQHGQGPAGQRQSSELHFPTYDEAGTHSGYGATRFAYDPTHPLPIQVETTLPGGRPSVQRYASFEDFQNRTGIGAGGATPTASSAARVGADARLASDRAAASQRIDDVAGTLVGAPRTLGVREGREAGRQEVAEESAQAPSLAGPAYTAAVGGLQPGESIEVPINPAYEPPPGTPAELDALMEQVHASQQAQRALRGTENAMTAQAGEQRSHEAQLGEAQTVAQDLGDGRTAHQSAVDATQTTNTEQQSTASETIQTLGRATQEATALTTLVGSLRMFQGLAHLFSYLPGDLGREAEGARNDTGDLIVTLSRVSETENMQSSVEGGRETMQQDAQRIETVSSDGTQTDEELATGQAGITQLTDANAQSLAETEATATLAGEERDAVAEAEAEAQSTHDELLAELQAWADGHRQARGNAIAEGRARYAELGCRVTEE